MYKIYIVEDDKKIKNELSILLQKYGYQVLTCNNFENVIDNILQANPHLVILDVNLPLYDGYYICRKLRKVSSVPIIIVTSRDSESDELMSLNIGADDYIAKPYNFQILLSRIALILKRAYDMNKDSNIINYKDIELNVSNSTISYNNQTVELTKNELRILYLLMQNPSNIITRDQIMNELWQSEQFIDDNTLTVNVNRLRKKLEEINLKDFLKTKRGQGYMI